MIEMRRAQLGFGDGLIAEEMSDLREAWMTHVDELLADEAIVTRVYEALAQRHLQSRRRGTPAEVVLRLLSSSTCATGATRCWSARCAPTWRTAISRGSVPTRCRRPRP